MLGRANRQTTFSDYWLAGKLPETSFWSIVRKWVSENLNEDMFAPLYSSGGRPSISPVYTFASMLVQFEKEYSDNEMEEASRFDDRVKYAITAPRDFEGIDAVTLGDHRRRLMGSEIGQKILSQTIGMAKDAGMFTEENLHVIDTFMVWGSSARQDTYTMIYQGIKMVLRILGFYSIKDEALKVLKRMDYIDTNKKPKINWEDSSEKKVLIDELVRDALSLIDYVTGKVKMTDELKNAVELLRKVSTQDVKQNGAGMWEIIDGTAKDRIISINDPEMRHGRKTSSKCTNGYKAEIITGGEKASIVMAVEVGGANVPDGTHMSDLIDEVEENGNAMDKLYGDCAYSDWEEIEKRESEGKEFRVKTPQPNNAAGGYTKDTFDINLTTGVVTCPGGESSIFDPSKVQERIGATVKFDAEKCNACPLKEQCTKSKSGRTINVHPYEDRIAEQREFQKTDEFKDDYAKRSNGERTISSLTRHGGRQGRYIGKQKTKWQLMMVSICSNVKAVVRFIYRKINEKPEGELCQIAA